MSYAIRKNGNDLASNKFYNSYANGTMNPFFGENAPKSVGGTMSNLKNKNALGNCTWYAFGRAMEVHGVRTNYPQMRGDAVTWGKNGEKLSTYPQAGGIVVFEDPNLSAADDYGHVAFIEYVDSNGNAILSESAYSERSNGFLFRFGRTINDVYKEWGMIPLRYLAPLSDNKPSIGGNTDYESLPNRWNNLEWKVGDIVEFTFMYPTVHNGERFEPKNKNKFGKGYGYINGLFPKDKHPYRISLTKGGATIGATEPVYISRVNHGDIIPKITPSKPKPSDRNAYGQKLKLGSYVEFTRLYADKNGNGGLDIHEMKYQHYRDGETVGFGYVIEILEKGSYCSYRIGNSSMEEIGFVRYDNCI